MEFININPGIKHGMKQPFTITVGGRIFFLTHNEANDAIEWNMFIDDVAERDLKLKIEKILINYLTNQ